MGKGRRMTEKEMLKILYLQIEYLTRFALDLSTLLMALVEDVYKDLPREEVEQLLQKLKDLQRLFLPETQLWKEQTAGLVDNPNTVPHSGENSAERQPHVGGGRTPKR
jgi:hypothetical protein